MCHVLDSSAGQDAFLFGKAEGTFIQESLCDAFKATGTGFAMASLQAKYRRGTLLPSKYAPRRFYLNLFYFKHH